MRRGDAARQYCQTQASEGGMTMPQVTRVGRVVVPVSDQDKAIAFYTPGRPTGILLTSPDPAADQAELAGRGVDVDAELMGGDGGVPVMFSFRDQDKNSLMIVQEA